MYFSIFCAVLFNMYVICYISAIGWITLWPCQDCTIPWKDRTFLRTHPYRPVSCSARVILSLSLLSTTSTALSLDFEMCPVDFYNCAEIHETCSMLHSNLVFIMCRRWDFKTYNLPVGGNWRCSSVLVRFTRRLPVVQEESCSLEPDHCITIPDKLLIT